MLLAAIIGLAIVVSTQLFAFFPGLLGAITLYILLRNWHFRLTVVHNWKAWLSATLLIVGSIVVFVIPFAVMGMLLVPYLNDGLKQASLLSGGLGAISDKLHAYIPQLSINETQIRGMMQRMAGSLPSALSATMQVVSNLLLCFFLLYFMLISGRKMERRLQSFISLKDENIDNIWSATRTMVVSNAIGIPLLAMFQAITATVSYLIFGVPGALVWGILTGICSMLPVVGTAIIWVPVVAYLFATGKSGAATGLLLFSVVITVNIDNVLRFTLLRKLGDVHPVMTVLGIIIGVPLFGFMGLIFGPLLLSYLLLLVKIYQVEFSGNRER